MVLVFGLFVSGVGLWTSVLFAYEILGSDNIAFFDKIICALQKKDDLDYILQEHTLK